MRLTGRDGSGDVAESSDLLMVKCRKTGLDEGIRRGIEEGQRAERGSGSENQEASAMAGGPRGDMRKWRKGGP